jgi:hypothetical protein
MYFETSAVPGTFVMAGITLTERIATAMSGGRKLRNLS